MKLREIAATLAAPVSMLIAVYAEDQTLSRVWLVIEPDAILPGASVFIEHQDPEGVWHESADVSHLLDREGERALAAGLAAVNFLSQTPAAIILTNDLATYAPNLLDT